MPAVKVLLVATRSPYGRQSGRKGVLNTIIGSLASLGHDVRVLAVTDEDAPGPSLETVPPPGPVRILANVLVGVPTGRRCFNECLYHSPALDRRVADICRSWAPDVVVADMIRVAEPALAAGPPVVLDLDDLLSRRYAELASGRADGSTILGYYGSSLPGFLRRAMSTVAARGVRVESALVARRERVLARRARAVSLVARAEAEHLERDLGRPVAWLLMSVAIPDVPAPVAANDADRLVFVGGLDYHANLEAIRWFVAEVAPRLRAVAGEEVRLRAIGFCPPEVEEELRGTAVDPAGYVDDLAAELAASRVFVAPIPPGTGVKTKVLEAMAAGLPVVSTTSGVDGLEATPGRDCLVADDAGAFAEAVATLMGDAERAAAIGAAGRRLVQEGFAPEIVTQRWAEVLATVTSAT